MPHRDGYDRLDDLALMRGIEARDPSAMQVLFDRYATRVLATCLRVVGQRSDAEDALETVFLELWRYPARFDPARGEPRAYLEILARSRALDLVRSRSRAEQRVLTAYSVGALDDTAPARPPAPLSRMLHQERQQVLRKAVDGLDESQRRVVELAFFAGVSHSRIAETLDLPLGTVKARMRAALRVLRRLLGPHDLDGGGDS